MKVHLPKITIKNIFIVKLSIGSWVFRCNKSVCLKNLHKGPEILIEMCHLLYQPVSSVHDRMLDSGDFGLALDAAGVERPDT